MHSSNPDQPLDLDREYGSNSGKVPSFLLALLVLTSINVVYNLYSALKELFVSAESAGSIEAEIYQSMDESGVDMSELPTWVMGGMMEFLEHYSANAVAIRMVDIVYYLLLGVAAVLMFRLKMAGFYLYLVVNILGVVVVPFLFGFNFISYSLAIVYAIVATIFIALYSANRKYLS